MIEAVAGEAGEDVSRWLMASLPSPSDTSKPLRLTDAQVDLFVALYQPDVRRAAHQGAKGIGKSPEGAFFAVAELVGPFAPPDPLVQIAALSEDQADSTVYSLLLGLLRADDSHAAKALGIDDGRGRLYRIGRPGKLEAITARSGSHEGERTTAAVLDETNLWLKSNGGHALARAIRRNLAKTGGRSLELSNAHEPGVGSVAEMTSAEAHKPGVLFIARRPSRTPTPDMADSDLLALIREVYQDAPWIDPMRILAELRDPQTLWDEGVRYFLNQPTASATALVDPRRWAELLEPGDIPDGSRVGIGFDGSHSFDGTALAVVDERGRVSVELLIERDASDPPEWTVPRSVVNAKVADLFGRFDVARMNCDPYYWRDEVDDWARQYGEDRVLRFPTNSGRRMGPAVDRFRVAITEGKLRHDGDPDLARHLANARLVRARGSAADDGHALFALEKRSAGAFIDAAVAAVLANEAIADAPPTEPVNETLMAWA